MRMVHNTSLGVNIYSSFVGRPTRVSGTYGMGMLRHWMHSPKTQGIAPQPLVMRSLLGSVHKVLQQSLNPIQRWAQLS